MPLSFNQVRDRLDGWVLFQPDPAKPTPLDADFAELPEPVRDRLIERLERALDVIESEGWPALGLGRYAHSSWIKGNASQIFCIRARSKNRTLANAYVTCEDRQPVLLLFATARSGPDVEAAARVAVDRRHQYLVKQHPAVVAAAAARATVTVPGPRSTPEYPPPARARRRAVPRPEDPGVRPRADTGLASYELPAALEREVMELIGRRQAIAAHWERIAARCEDPGEAALSPELAVQAERANALAVAVGYHALTEPAPPPALSVALGRLRKGDPKVPATWVAGRRTGSDAIALALLAADAFVRPCDRRASAGRADLRARI